MGEGEGYGERRKLREQCVLQPPLILTSWASGCFWETRLGKKLSV